MTMNIAEMEAEMEAEEMLTLALFDVAHDTLLPELATTIGHAQLLDFLDRFEGCVIEIPSAATLLSAARDASLYRRVEDGELPKDLAVELGLTENDVTRIFKRMSALASCSWYLEDRRERRRRQRDRKRAALAKARRGGSS